MAKEKCPNPQPECKYAPKCFADRHHIYPQRLGKTALSKQFLNLPENIVVMCRRLHETQAIEKPLPKKVEMKEAIARAALSGEINLTQTKLKSIFNVSSIEEIRTSYKE